jgi:hypothetical protein
LHICMKGKGKKRERRERERERGRSGRDEEKGATNDEGRGTRERTLGTHLPGRA